MARDRKLAKEYNLKWRERHKHPCLDCGKLCSYVSLRCRVCAGKVRWGKHTGAKCANWKGGRNIHNGYVRLWLAPGDFFYPMADKHGYVREHRLIMAKKLGRCLASWEIVHHKDGVKDHNTDDNLEITTKGSHSVEHNKGYQAGYRQGYVDAQNTKLNDLMTEIRLLRFENKELKEKLWQIK